MKQILSLLFLLFILYGCNSSDRQGSDESENDVDAARNFINASLAGDFQKARTFMLRDSINEERMNLIERVNLSPEEKKGLAGASLRIHNVSRPVQDSVTIVIYSNSYKNNQDTLRVLRQNGEWRVDFNYLFDHDSDSLFTQPIFKPDSLPQ